MSKVEQDLKRSVLIVVSRSTQFEELTRVHADVVGGGGGGGGGLGRIVVQKFGGSSVADPDRIRRCCERVRLVAESGAKVVVVVSAMGDTTDDLIALAGKVASTNPSSAAASKREMDQLLATGEQVSIALVAMCLQGMGLPAVSLTGQQAGVHTDTNHSRARIRSVERNRLVAELAQGRIPIVAGFQGLNEHGDVTTLGRGGSDTSAVALAVALDAEECQIFTDVDGIYTTDPRIVSDARLLETISYEEMMEAASQGARVMHLRSVELGKNARTTTRDGMPIRVLHSQRLGRGTVICNQATRAAAMENSQAVSVIALKNDLGRVTLEDLPNVPGIQRQIFERIAHEGISVDDIIQHEVETEKGTKPGDRCNIVFTLDKADLPDVQPIIESFLKDLGEGRQRIDLGLVKVSAIGVGMQSQPGVAATLFRAIADAGIVIHNITTSEIKISMLLTEQDGPRAVRVAHDAFGLSQAGAPVSVETKHTVGSVVPSR